MSVCFYYKIKMVEPSLKESWKRREEKADGIKNVRFRQNLLDTVHITIFKVR